MFYYKKNIIQKCLWGLEYCGWPLSSLLSPIVFFSNMTALWSSSMLSLPTASPDRREVTELTSILLSAEPASTAAAGVSEPADSQIHRRKGKCVSGGAPAQHPPPSSLSLLRLTWQTPTSRRPLARHCAPPTRPSPSPFPSWGREAGYGRKGKSHRCPEICLARFQPSVPAPTRRKFDIWNR